METNPKSPSTITSRRGHLRESLWLFAHTLGNAALFIVIGAVAVGIDWLERRCAAWGTTKSICDFLGGAAFILLAWDLVSFFTLQFFLMREFIRGLSRP